MRDGKSQNALMLLAFKLELSTWNFLNINIGLQEVRIIVSEFGILYFQEALVLKSHNILDLVMK